MRCFDVRVRESCLTAQSVALAGRYGEVHGALLANDFRGGAGIVVGASWGGDVGTPLYRLARDRLRLGARLTLDAAILYHGAFDFDFITFGAGPQLWIRLSRLMFLTTRLAAGGSLVFFDVGPVSARSYSFTPTIDVAIGLAFDLAQ